MGAVVRATAIHGEAGIGNTVLPASPVEAVPEHAVDLIARILRDHPEPVTIAPIGPLTNIALLLRLHPELAPKIAHLCLMGGSIGDGNATAAVVIADTIGIGTIVRHKVPVFVAQRGQLAESLLGMNFIGTLSSFEIRGDRMILRD